MTPRLTSVVGRNLWLSHQVLIPTFIYFSIAVINIDQTKVGVESVYPVYILQYITERGQSRNST